jgi:hypothetical protein
MAMAFAIDSRDLMCCAFRHDQITRGSVPKAFLRRSSIGGIAIRNGSPRPTVPVYKGLK